MAASNNTHHSRPVAAGTPNRCEACRPCASR